MATLLIANICGLAAVFAATWFGLSMTSLNEAQVPIYAIAISAVIGATCLFLWQKSSGIDTTNPVVIGFGVFCGVLGIAGSFLIDSLIAGVNPFDSSQWAGLWK